IFLTWGLIELGVVIKRSLHILFQLRRWITKYLIFRCTLVLEWRYQPDSYPLTEEQRLHNRRFDMKSGLRAIMNVTGLALCLVFAVTATVQAQNREKYVISAKAGGINLVSGDVTVRHEGAKTRQALTAKDDLESGDVVLTGQG